MISFLVHSPPFSLLRSLDKLSLHFCLQHFFLGTSFLSFPHPPSHPVPLQLFSESKDVPCFQASLAFASWFRRRHFRQSPVRAALALRVMARALHSGDEATVPHSCPTQLAEVMQAAGDAGQQVELIEQTPRLEGRETKSFTPHRGMNMESRGSPWPPVPSPCLATLEESKLQQRSIPPECKAGG